MVTWATVLVGPAPVEALPRRKRGGRNAGWEVYVEGRWIPDGEARAAGHLSRPLPIDPPGPVTRRQAEPEPPAPPREEETMAAPTEPTERQAEAWRLCHDEGLSYTEASRRLGITFQAAKERVEGYAARIGWDGDDLPGSLAWRTGGALAIKIEPDQDGAIGAVGPEAVPVAEQFPGDAPHLVALRAELAHVDQAIADSQGFLAQMRVVRNYLLGRLADA